MIGEGSRQSFVRRRKGRENFSTQSNEISFVALRVFKDSLHQVAGIKSDGLLLVLDVVGNSDGKWPPDRERENINRKQAVGDFKPNSLLFDMWWKKSLTGVSYVRNEGVSFLRILQLNSDSTVGRFLIRQLAEFCLGVWRKNPENRTLFQRIWGLKRTLF